ncbi:hypothetical protein RUND412_011470 [Rhizina undulata]
MNAAAAPIDRANPIDIDVLAIEGARKFIDSYYDAVNKDRTLLRDFYHREASIMWNGNLIKPADTFIDFFTPQPFANFDVQAYDAQSMGFDDDRRLRFLITVSGNVKWGEKKLLKGFSDSFVLSSKDEIPDRFYVISQTFRIVV